MTKELTHESWKIANVIYCLYRPLAREYREERIQKGRFKVDGFEFEHDVWCWIVWKPTDISRNPEYKGEPLAKVVPNIAPLTREQIEIILDAQPWCYV